MIETSAPMTKTVAKMIGACYSAIEAIAPINGASSLVINTVT
jgi:hypothetical protein